MADKLILNTIKMVVPLPNYLLFIEFEDGVSKVYDVNRLFNNASLAPIFNELKTKKGLFEKVRVASHGIGIVWNDRVDFNCNDLYRFGKTVQTNTNIKPIKPKTIKPHAPEKR